MAASTRATRGCPTNGCWSCPSCCPCLPPVPCCSSVHVLAGGWRACAQRRRRAATHDGCGCATVPRARGRCAAGICATTNIFPADVHDHSLVLYHNPADLLSPTLNPTHRTAGAVCTFTLPGVVSRVPEQRLMQRMVSCCICPSSLLVVRDASATAVQQEVTQRVQLATSRDETSKPSESYA